MNNSNVNSENEVLQRIRDHIKWDKRVSLADLNITARNGVIVLNGYVDSTYKKNAALDIVSSTEGVWSVENHITVPMDYFRADDEIKTLVEKQLQDLNRLSGEHIEVEVLEGVVKLEGEVFRPRLKAMADSVVWELSGVRDCLNFIEITTPPQRLPAVSPVENQDNVLAFASN